MRWQTLTGHTCICSRGHVRNGDEQEVFYSEQTRSLFVNASLKSSRVVSPGYPYPLVLFRYCNLHYNLSIKMIHVCFSK